MNQCNRYISWVALIGNINILFDNVTSNKVFVDLCKEIPVGKFSWSSKFSSHTTKIFVSGPMVTVDGRPNRRVRKAGASWGELGLSMVLLRGSVRGLSRESVVGLVPPGPSLGVLTESCGDLSGTNQHLLYFLSTEICCNWKKCLQILFDIFVSLCIL